MADLRLESVTDTGTATRRADHTALKDAVRWGHVARNVAASADLPKGMAPEMHVWSPEQLRKGGEGRTR